MHSMSIRFAVVPRQNDVIYPAAFCPRFAQAPTEKDAVFSVKTFVYIGY